MDEVSNQSIKTYIYRSTDNIHGNDYVTCSWWAT